MNETEARQYLHTLTHSTYAGLGLGNSKQLRGVVIYKDCGCKCQYYLRDYSNVSPSRFVTPAEALELVKNC